MKKYTILMMIILLVGIIAFFPGAEGEDSIIVTDARGEEIKLESPPEQIVSYMASNTELLFHIGVGDRVVGVDDYSDYPSEVEELPSVGDAFEPDIELIISLEPDLVVTAEYNTGLINDLEGHEITVFSTSSTTLEDVYNDMRILGEICGVSEEANSLAQELKDDMGELTEETRDVPEEERPSSLYITGTYQGINTVGSGTFIHSLLENAGLYNVAEEEKGWLTLNEEEVVTKNPEVIIASEETKPSLEEFINKDSWQHITAVEEENVYYVDADLLSRPGPRVIDGQEILVDIAQGIIVGEQTEDEEIPGYATSGLLVTAVVAALIYNKRKKD